MTLTVCVLFSGSHCVFQSQGSFSLVFYLRLWKTSSGVVAAEARRELRVCPAWLTVGILFFGNHCFLPSQDSFHLLFCHWLWETSSGVVITEACRELRACLGWLLTVSVLFFNLRIPSPRHLSLVVGDISGVVIAESCREQSISDMTLTVSVLFFGSCCTLQSQDSFPSAFDSGYRRNI